MYFSLTGFVKLNHNKLHWIYFPLNVLSIDILLREREGATATEGKARAPANVTRNVSKWLISCRRTMTDNRHIYITGENPLSHSPPPAAACQLCWKKVFSVVVTEGRAKEEGRGKGRLSITRGYQFHPHSAERGTIHDEDEKDRL